MNSIFFNIDIRTTFRCIDIDVDLLENFDSESFLRKEGFLVPWDVLEQVATLSNLFSPSGKYAFICVTNSLL
jgi:hypothetical protein